LFDKRGIFGAGEAYSTPYSFHLLNVRARDMSAFEDKPGHFIDWLELNQDLRDDINPTLPVSEQYVPRLYYGRYLQDLLHKMQINSHPTTKLTLMPGEVIDAIPEAKSGVKLILQDQKEMQVDKVVLALGNACPAPFPFTVSPTLHCIHQPWDYKAPSQIGKKDVVMIIGTGLSMIDVVLTLHHQGHQNCIYALSRRGLLPLPHAKDQLALHSIEKDLPQTLRLLMQMLRKKSEYHMNTGGDWRSIMNAIRTHVPDMWANISLPDKKRFIRHALPYWNIHRHRVHHHLTDLLKQLSADQQLHVLAGRVLGIDENNATIKLRNTNQLMQIEGVKWLINCMGPALNVINKRGPLVSSLLQRGIASFDSLNLGFNIAPSLALKESSGNISTTFYTLGPPTKSAYWESVAVPEIRKQSLDLARHFLKIS
jgi:uncharacterized NAD(P)/FAD-binding protein YdhS